MDSAPGRLRVSSRPTPGPSPTLGRRVIYG